MTAPEIFEYESVPAAHLRKGDRLVHPDRGVFTLADRPLVLRPLKVDPAQQWLTLRFVEDVPEIEVHQGDYFDRLVG